MVSVLMTAYNREKYIGAAIESVLASTYTDFELIVVDDISKDRTVEVVRELAANDPRIKLYVNEKNIGDYPNRNQCAYYARGKYLKYVDCDDYIYPWALELLVEMMERHPGCGWGLCSLPQTERGPFPFVLTPKEAYRYHYMGPGLFHKAPLSSIIKAEVLRAAGGFASERYTGDTEMWHKLAQRYDVLLMPEGMVWYREHDAQESKRNQRFLRNYEAIYVRYLKSDQCPLDPADVRTIIRKKKRYLAGMILRWMIKMKFSTARIYWECLAEYYGRKN